MNVAILGRRGSGKTTIAQLLVSQFGYTRHSWAAPVKEIAAWAYGPVEKAATYTITDANGFPSTVTGRWLLQRIGTEALRNQVDRDFWIRVGLRKIDMAPTDDGEPATWVNDDTRFPNEVQALRSRGFLIVYLDVPQAVRIERLGAEFDPRADEHPSETSVGAKHADEVVDGTLPPEAIARLIYETAC